MSKRTRTRSIITGQIIEHPPLDDDATIIIDSVSAYWQQYRRDFGVSWEEFHGGKRQGRTIDVSYEDVTHKRIE